MDKHGDWLTLAIKTIQIERLTLLNSASFFAAACEFGLPLWMGFIIAAAAVMLTKANYSREIVTRLGIVAALLTLLEWSEILPPARQLLITVRSIFANLHA